MKSKYLLLLLSVIYLGACNDKPEVEPISNGPSLSAYPNPFFDYVSIKAFYQGNQPSLLRVFDPEGKIILEEEVSQSKHDFSLDLQGEAAGTYHAVIQTAEAKNIIKLIKL